MENKKLNPALVAAGKLAITARAVVSATTKELSKRIEAMEAALDVYDNEVIALQNALTLRPVFWFMRDNNIFCKLQGNNIEEIKVDILRIAKENPCGKVCPVIILSGETVIRNVGKYVHVDENGNVDLSEWYDEIMKDDVVRSYDGI